MKYPVGTRVKARHDLSELASMAPIKRGQISVVTSANSNWYTVAATEDVRLTLGKSYSFWLLAPHNARSAL